MGGSCICIIGNYVIDASLLPVVGLSEELGGSKDFASDVHVLKLASTQTLQMLDNYACSDNVDTSLEDIGVLSTTLYFFRLHLCSINGDSIPSNNRVLYLWSSALWLLTISRPSIITKRNIASEAIPMSFLILRSDVIKPCAATEEPTEHEFGMLRNMIREFTTLEFVRLSQKSKL